MASADTMPRASSPGVAIAARHALAWLVVGNAIGVMLAILLLVPSLNLWLGEWTYGRWMMVHMNTALFGWASLPMVAFLLHAYRVDSGALATWCRPVVWLWSAALLAGCCSWLGGHSSGKLFLDWSGFPRLFFPLALVALWVLLAMAFVHRPGDGVSRVAKVAGLLVLLAVPFALYFASDPTVYPRINPDTCGPTGQSQLESSLGVVLILLAVPFGIAPRKRHTGRAVWLAWVVFAAESLLCFALGRADVSHRVLAQWLSLASLLLWIPLVPAYYRAFTWRAATRSWQIAFLCWWAALVLTGWFLFLPGILDRVKFTDVLVGHSLTAVAGFLSALLLFVLVQLLDEQDTWVLTRRWSFLAWNLGVAAYVVVMSISGWMEFGNPEFTIIPGTARAVLYTLRLLTGLAMLAASLDWWVSSFSFSSAASAKPSTALEAEAA